MTPLKAIWFSGGKGKIAIVQAVSDHGEIGYFIGAGDGLHEVIDINNIANLGAEFPTEVAEVLFKKGMKDEQDKKQQGVRRLEKGQKRARGISTMEDRTGH